MAYPSGDGETHRSKVITSPADHVYPVIMMDEFSERYASSFFGLVTHPTNNNNNSDKNRVFIDTFVSQVRRFSQRAYRVAQVGQPPAPPL